MSDWVIIVAGGKGLRMGTDIPKQFLPIDGLPILMRTIRRFREYSSNLRIVLVLPRHQQDYWRGLCEQYHFNESYTIADGGATRYESVQNGLAVIPDDEDGVVGIHDGVRPFVSTEVIGRCYEAARRDGAAIPVMPVIETLRYVGEGDAKAHNVARSDYRLVQTPQAFSIALFKRAAQQPPSDRFTDDASVVEAIGQTVTMVEGNRENIKITTKYDLEAYPPRPPRREGAQLRTNSLLIEESFFRKRLLN